jgi:hypothetical protein
MKPDPKPEQARTILLDNKRVTASANSLNLSGFQSGNGSPKKKAV